MKSCKHCDQPHEIRGAACRVCKDGIYRYGLNRLAQLKLHESQGGKCQICQSEVEMFSGYTGGFVDHCHVTGRVRGILCSRCNTIVGSLETNPNLEAILSYLKLNPS